MCIRDRADNQYEYRDFSALSNLKRHWIDIKDGDIEIDRVVEDSYEDVYKRQVHICQVRYLKVTLYFLGTTDLKFFLQMLIWDRL